FRQRYQLTAVDDVDFLVGRLCANQARCEAEALTKTERRWFLGDERIRAGFDEKIADSFRSDRAADSGRRFQKREFDAERLFLRELSDPVRGGESGDTS